MKSLGRLKDERAVPALAAMLVRRKRFARSRQRALKTGAIQALRTLGTPDALAALAQAAKTDRLVRKLTEVLT